MTYVGEAYNIVVKCLDCDESIGLVTEAFYWLVDFLKKHNGHRISVRVKEGR